MPARDTGDRPLRWPWRVAAAAPVCLCASTLLAPRPGAPLVVVLGVDGHGWSFLAALATAALTGTAVGGLVHVLTRGRSAWWADLLTSVTFLLLTLAALLALPIALLVGSLAFKNSYRDLGAVDGRDVVVQQFAGWDGDDDVAAGFRIGPFVSFEARSDGYLRRPSAGIDAWHFVVGTTPGAVLVDYRAGDGPRQSGVLRLPRP